MVRHFGNKTLVVTAHLIAALIFFSPVANAQTMQFQHLTSEDGISQSEIYSFLEDSQGFMWFGTVDGLNRFDGYQVDIYNIDKDNPNSISNNTIRCLAEDNAGRIWIGTDDGLCVYEPKSGIIHQVPLGGHEGSHMSINTSLVQDQQLYIGTSMGLFSIDLSAPDIQEIGKSADQIRKADGTNSYHVVSCTVGAGGEVWIASSDVLFQLNSLNQSQLGLTKVLDLGNVLPDIRDLVEDTFGNLWVVSHDNGFIRYNPKSGQLRHFQKGKGPGSTNSNKISTVTIDMTGNLWIGTHDQGLIYLEKYYLNDKNPRFQTVVHDPYIERGLNSNLIYSIYVSKNNLLWIGTIGSGINIYNPNRKPFQYYNLHSAANESSSSTNFIRSVYADNTDNLWVGTHNNGLFYINRETRAIDKMGFGTESIFHINEVGGGLIAVSTGKGVSLVRKKADKVDIVSQLMIGPSFYATQVIDGSFWIATLNGVKKCNIENGKLKIEASYNTESTPALSYNNCRVVAYDESAHSLLIGTEGGGLNVMQLNQEGIPFSVEVYKNETDDMSLGNNYIRSIVLSSDSEAWIGTYEGLNKMYTDKASGDALFQTYTTKDGLPNNTIQSIVEDNQDNLWIGTNKGLCKFEKGNESFTQFTINDGIQSNEFSEHAIFKKKDNEIIIGGVNGINTFYPEQIVSTDIQSHMTITAFYLSNKIVHVNEEQSDDGSSPLLKSITLTDTLILKPQQNSFGFDFSAMTFSAPEKVQYAYILEGFDKEWMITDASNRRANYTNLEYGEYTFSVKSLSSDGLQEGEPSSIFIKIKTPWYRTMLAYIIYGLLGIAALIFFTNYSVLKYTTKEKILLENEHNRKLVELDELRSRLFINVSHDLRTPLTLIASPLDLVLRNGNMQGESRSLLQLVQRNVKKLRDMTEQLLDITKTESGELRLRMQTIDFVSFVKNEVMLFQNAFQAKGVDLNVISGPNSILLSFDPDMLSKVIANLLSNALKYTAEGHVHARISVVKSGSVPNLTKLPIDEFIKLEIQDTGEGINEQEQSRIFERFYQSKHENKKGYGIGLSHTKDLIEAHNGSIEVVSEKGVGTSFIAYIPMVQDLENLNPEVLPVTTQTVPMKTVEAVQQSFQMEPGSTAPIATQKILLVEDNPDLRNFISTELQKYFEVIEAADGEQGMALAIERFPNLIISDVMMPRKDGMEFCKEIKTNIKTSHIPVILLTARVDKESKYKGLEIGADDYISKPFDMELLLLRIRNLLQNRERMRALFQDNYSFEPAKVTVTSIDEEFLSQLMVEIEKGISVADFTISALEHTMGMSHSSFYNKIKSLTGQSAKELIFAARMKRAKQILEDTDKIRISEVAYMVGFTDPKYFSKRFKEYFGGSPSEYVNKK